MRVNMGKSSIIPIGRSVEPENSHGIPCTNTDRYLGVQIGNDRRTEQPKVMEYLDTCKKWKSNSWDTLSKVPLVNAYCVGKLAHVAPFLESTYLQRERICNAYWGAIWGSRAHRLAQERAIAPRDNGGVGALQIKKWLEANLAWWAVTAIRSTEKWASVWRAVAGHMPPSKRGNLIQRGEYY